MYKKLFTPIKIRGLELKNRVVLPAMMTKMTTDDYQGIVSDNLIEYHGAIAKGGCGLNITEVMAVHPSTHGYAYCALYEDKHEPQVKKLIDNVHANGGKICIQLWHGGKTVNSMIELLPEDKRIGRNPVMPTENNVNKIPISLIDEIVEAFGKSAARAVRLGADVLEYHTAHMYLGHSFLSKEWNQRTDEYGGSLENRARFILRVIKEIRKNMPNTMPLFMRIDVHDDFLTNGLSIEDIAQVLTWVHELGVDVADVSRGNAVTPALRYEVPTMDTPNGFNMEDIKKLKSLLPKSMLVMGVGRVNSPELAEKLLDENYIDLIAMGRAQICDHEFVNKVKDGKESEIRRCIACNKGCFDSIMDKRMPHIMCSRNVFVGNYGRKINKVDKQHSKIILIAGGGIAGISAARFLKLRGHNPILCEKSSELGGQMNFAKSLDYKFEWVNMLNWEIDHAKKEGVEIRLNTCVTPELIEEIKPDSVIIATGAYSVVELLDGVDKEKLVLFEDVLSNKVKLDGNVIILGGGMYGCETAQALAQKGIKATILEDGPMLATDAGWIRAFNLMINVQIAGINYYTAVKNIKFKNNQVDFIGIDSSKEEKHKTVNFDYLIQAHKPVSDPFETLESKCKELKIPCYRIGDAKQVESVMWAVNQAADVAFDEIK